MAKRQQVRDLQGPEALQTHTRIQDVFTRVDRQRIEAPRGAGRSFEQLSRALGVGSAAASRAETEFTEEQKAEAFTQASAARLKSQKNWAEATEAGEVEPGQNPFFERWYKRLDGEAAAEAAFFKGGDLIQNSELAVSDNPAEVEAALAQLGNEHVEGVEDLDFLDAFHSQYNRHMNDLLVTQVKRRIDQRTLQGQVEYQESIERYVDSFVEMHDVDDPQAISQMNAGLQNILDTAALNGMPKTFANDLMISSIAKIVEEHGPGEVGNLLAGVKSGSGELRNTRKAKDAIRAAADSYYANHDREADRKFRIDERERSLALRKESVGITRQILSLRNIEDPLEKQKAADALRASILQVPDAAMMAGLDARLNTELEAANADVVSDNDLLRLLISDLYDGNTDKFDDRLHRLYRDRELSTKDYEDLLGKYEDSLSGDGGFGWMKVGDNNNWAASLIASLQASVGSRDDYGEWIPGPAIAGRELDANQIEGLSFEIREHAIVVISRHMEGIDENDVAAINEARKAAREELTQYVAQGGSLELAPLPDAGETDTGTATPPPPSTDRLGETHVLPSNPSERKEVVEQRAQDRTDGAIFVQGGRVVGDDLRNHLRENTTRRIESLSAHLPGTQLGRLRDHLAARDEARRLINSERPSDPSEFVKWQTAKSQLQSSEKALANWVEPLNIRASELRKSLRMNRERYNEWVQQLEYATDASNPSHPDNMEARGVAYALVFNARRNLERHTSDLKRRISIYDRKRENLMASHELLGAPLGAMVDREPWELGLPADAVAWEHYPAYQSLKDLEVGVSEDLNDPDSDLMKLAEKAGYETDNEADLKAFAKEFVAAQKPLIINRITQ